MEHFYTHTGNKNNMRFICFLSILAFTEAFNVNPAEYTNYIVRLGDPWQVTCETPYREPTQWWFNSALLYFNYYIYRNSKIVLSMEDRYIMRERHVPHEYILKVTQTDKYHAGLYQCIHKNGATEEGSQYYKLTLIDKSYIELLADGNNRTKLTMNISYAGSTERPPVFQCTFHYGDRIMQERTCMDNMNELLTCSLEIIYGPDDDPPFSCQISFETNNKIWNATKLSIVQNSLVSYAKEEESYSVSCDTASTISMSWYFNGVLRPTNESLLFASWTVQPQVLNRFNFTYSNESKTYSMMIAHVDVNHAGTYLCTHKSNRHLVKKKIELVVIEQSSIRFSGDNPTTLIMSTSYIGHNVPTPLFQCMSHNKLITLDNKECLVTKNGSTKCHIEQVYDLHSDVPDKCQIWFEYVIVKEVTSKDQTNLQSKTSSKTINIVVVIIVVIILIIIVFSITITYFICKRKKKKLFQMEQRLLPLEENIGPAGRKRTRTIGIRSLNDEPIKRIDILKFACALNKDANTIEYIDEYVEGSHDLCTLTFYSHEGAISFRNKFISKYGTSSYKLTLHETWPVRHDAFHGMEIILIGDGMEESDIRSCLEDEKYGGVKDSIEEVVFKDEKTVVVVFKDASDLQNVLSKNSVIKLQNTRLHLKVMKPLMPPVHVPDDEVDRRKLWFRNIHACNYGDEIMLRSFIENISQSEIDYFIFYDDDVCVSMKSSPNYSRIMMETCTRPFNGHMIKVQMMPQTLQIQVATSSPMSKDDVKSYFSDKKKSGGGPVSNIEFKYDYDKRKFHETNFTLWYNKSEDIDNVSRRFHEIDGIKCCATPYYDGVFDDWIQGLPYNFDPNKPPLLQLEGHLKALRTIGIRKRKMIDIMSFIRRSKFNFNTIEYFEEYDDDVHYFVFTFSSCGDAVIFTNKGFSYFSWPLELTWHETWPVRLDACRGMEIKLDGDGMDESDIRSCLEDEKYGGVKDSIEEVVFKDEKTVVVVFKDASDLQNVWFKNSVIELQNTTLHLNVMKPLMPPLYVPDDEADRRKLWFRNIHARSYGDETMLRSFIENISQSEIDYFIFYDDDDICVSMKSNPNYSRIMMETCTRPFNGHMIKVQMMPQTLQIEVTTSSLMSKDEVKSYFSDNKKFGGGTVSEIGFKFDEDKCEFIKTHFILLYNKSEDVDNVSKRLHEIYGIKCCATPYYDISLRSC